MYKAAIILLTVLFATACSDSTSTSVEPAIDESNAVAESVETVAAEPVAIVETVVAETSSEADKPAISATQKVLLTATVEAINHETRAVSLRGPEGSIVEIVASEDIRNLNQVSVGDSLNIEYVQSISIEVVAAVDAEAGIAVIAAEVRSDEGEMPGVAALEAIVINAVVEEINLEENTFKLKGADGEVTEFTARDPENLKKAVVGDLVVITLTEAVAITVEHKTEE
ncbi:MAG: hypothetical protein L3J24_15160 [Xanthomonadales bacterium]|nr:hypothetical protein [Xanthomonadales bacterium]